MSTAPPRVGDDERYWTDPPPEKSARCLWWEQRIRDGWRGNRRIRSMDYYEASAYYGVHIWEYLNVIVPLLQQMERR